MTGYPISFTNRTSTLSSYFNYAYTSNTYSNYYSVEESVLVEWRRKTFWEFVTRNDPKPPAVNLIAILMTTINPIRKLLSMRQPRWRSGRWKSTT